MPVTKKYTSASNEFRSDTFTTPTQSMLNAVFQASVGDAVYDEDSDTVELEEYLAELTGKDAGLYCVSGTLANQIGIRTHLHQPPYSILCDYRSHIYVHEGAGLAMLSNAMVIPVKPSNGDYLTLEDIKKHIIPEDGDIHGAPTQLISLENTLHGVVFPYEELKRIREFCTENDYRLHCDGARLWNASVASGVTFKQYGEIFDSISICLSKSIGAPIGSVLVGDKKFIRKANHFRKQNGGGIRQSGLLTRMARVAIDENLPKLKSSHDKAKNLADFLIENGIHLQSPVDTNFVFIDLEKSPINSEIFEKLGEEDDIRVWGGRIAFNYQTSDESLEKVKKVILQAYELTKEQGTNGEADKKTYHFESDR